MNRLLGSFEPFFRLAGRDEGLQTVSEVKIDREIKRRDVEPARRGQLFRDLGCPDVGVDTDGVSLRQTQRVERLREGCKVFYVVGHNPERLI